MVSVELEWRGIGRSTRDGLKIKRAPLQKGALELADFAGLEAEGKGKLNDARAGDS